VGEDRGPFPWLGVLLWLTVILSPVLVVAGIIVATRR